MVSFDEFEEMLAEVSEEIPEKYYTELNGGVSASPVWKLHPKSRGTELSILGEYRVEYGLGRRVVLYYGSFAHVCGVLDKTALRARIKEVLEHELTHHLESLAGEKDLEIQDAVNLYKYLEVGREGKPL
ncbi:MAG TPA: metallopeptidase family protein [Lachnospiraceae bacterium]|nr:metallopeptidase family protein [Lachnospiraceae bacterium]